MLQVFVDVCVALFTIYMSQRKRCVLSVKMINVREKPYGVSYSCCKTIAHESEEEIVLNEVTARPQSAFLPTNR